MAYHDYISAADLRAARERDARELIHNNPTPAAMTSTITRADIDAAVLAAAAASGTDAHLDAMKQCVALIRGRRAERAAMHTDTEAQRDVFARLAATARPDFMQHFGSARLVADRPAVRLCLPPRLVGTVAAILQKIHAAKK